MQGIVGEMRWVATMMVDLVGSTALTEKLGAEKAFQLVEDVLKRAVTVLEAEGGHFVDFAGDSLFAIFGAPVAIENAALCAARAALAIQEANTAQTRDLMARYGVAPQLRIGLAGGKVLVATLRVSQQGKLNALGNAVNLAARVQALAGPGEIFCAEAIAAEIEGFAVLEPTGTHRMKGFTDAQTLFRLRGLSEDPSNLTGRMARGTKVYVGRTRLVVRLQRWIDAPEAAPALMLVTGPPGIGKSRLVRHALDGLTVPRRVAVAYCTPSDARSSLEPVLNLLRAAGRAAGAATPAALGDWLGTLLASAQPNAGLLALLAGSARQGGAMMGEGASDALETRRHIVEALGRLVVDPSHLLIVEDAHWLDPISRSILSDLVTLQGARLLLTSRDPAPLLTPVAPDGRIDVPPLTPLDIAALCSQALPVGENADATARIIFQKSEGNPLFAEELLRHLAGGSAEPAAPNAASNAAGAIGSIQSLIFSRFDQLGLAEKAALKQAALIGRQIQSEHLGTADDQAAAILQEAARQGIVEMQDGTGPWQFSHVLIQEAIAGAIPEVEAAALHLSATQILLAHEPDPGGNLARRLARHFELAGLPQRATPFHLAAAQAAWRVYALDVCLDHLGRAEAQLDASEADPDDRLMADVITGYLRVLDVVGRWVQLAEVADRHTARLRLFADQRPLIFALTIRGKAANQCCDFVHARQLIDEALALAEAVGDENSIAVVKTGKMDIVNDRPDWDAGDVPRLFEETRAYADRGHDPHMAQLRLYEMASHYRQVGDVPKALAMSDDLIALGKSTSDSRALAFGWWVRASISAMIEDYPKAGREAEESMTNSLPGTMDHITANMFRLSARIMAGDKTISAAYLTNLSAERAAVGDTSVSIIASFFATVLHFTRGEVRAGLAQMKRTDKMVDHGAERGLVQQYLIKKAELFLTIAGLWPNPLPAPKMALAEVPAALKLRLRARGLAKATYADLRARLDLTEGFHLARVEMGEGRIAMAEGRRADGERLMNRAALVFAAQGQDRFLQMLATFQRKA